MSEKQSPQAAVEEELTRFIEAVKASPEYQRFDAAREQLQADDDASALMTQFERTQTEFQENEFDQDLMAELGDLQDQMADNETITEFRAAREELNELLRETDEVVSDHLEQQFAQPNGGGCC
jgi:cell fate (sporulation/competence/biofilm development) regulator YlbF (YheA/YmcA/DUF963 family)